MYADVLPSLKNPISAWWVYVGLLGMVGTKQFLRKSKFKKKLEKDRENQSFDFFLFSYGKF